MKIVAKKSPLTLTLKQVILGPLKMEERLKCPKNPRFLSLARSFLRFRQNEKNVYTNRQKQICHTRNMIYQNGKIRGKGTFWAMGLK